VDYDPELDKVFESVADYFGLLAEPARLKILHCLCDGERSVADVVDQSGLSQTNTSRHLNMLYRAGIVGRRKDGAMVFYKLIDPNFPSICRTVCIQIASGNSLNMPHRPSKASLKKVGKSLELASEQE
jgi:DNA-binding transcriptional ArsR family regulator